MGESEKELKLHLLDTTLNLVDRALKKKNPEDKDVLTVLKKQLKIVRARVKKKKDKPIQQ